MKGIGGSLVFSPDDNEQDPRSGGLEFADPTWAYAVPKDPAVQVKNPFATGRINPGQRESVNMGAQYMPPEHTPYLMILPAVDEAKNFAKINNARLEAPVGGKLTQQGLNRIDQLAAQDAQDRMMAKRYMGIGASLHTGIY